ncbi:hypothetical protein LSAT2_014452 [Lamellibrachia satsuma]|nr:hypothetical protein LSAT2_014452 [Lamellibrachia satsuma]
MALRSRLNADPHEVLRIIDDMNKSDLSDEDDSASDEEGEISLAVTPDHSNSDIKTPRSSSLGRKEWRMESVPETYTVVVKVEAIDEANSKCHVTRDNAADPCIKYEVSEDWEAEINYEIVLRELLKLVRGGGNKKPPCHKKTPGSLSGAKKLSPSQRVKNSVSGEGQILAEANWNDGTRLFSAQP